MKKIMFNDKYGLTKAVLDGRKTMTRRVVKLTDYDVEYLNTAFDWDLREFVIINRYAKYKVGEVVAVAQSYKDLGYIKGLVEQHISPNPNAKPTDSFEKKYPGWNNKMFVPAELNMAQRIRITDIKVERMQGISDEDCMKEGIRWDYVDFPLSQEKIYRYDDLKKYRGFCTPRTAFADLINKISGKGTWESNPYVFAYEFELVKEGGEE